MAMAKAMGRAVTGILFGAFRRGTTAGLRPRSRPAPPHVGRRGRRGPARLRPEVVIVPGYGSRSPRPAHARGGARGGARGAAASRWSSRSTRRRPHAGAHERAARRGERALRGAQARWTRSTRVQDGGPRARRRRERRRESGREDLAGLADLRHADPRVADARRSCSSSARCVPGSPASRTSCSTSRRPRCCSAMRRTSLAKVLNA